MYEIKEIFQNEVDLLLDSTTGEDDYEPRGLFYITGKDKIIGIDNSEGSAFFEEFDTLDECIGWLKGEFEIDEYLKKKNKY